MVSESNGTSPGPWFNIKILSYQYRKSHCGDKTVVRSSYLHNGISYTGKTTSLYWIGALIIYALKLIRLSICKCTQLNEWSEGFHVNFIATCIQFQYKCNLLRYKDSYHKDQIFMKLSYLIRGIPIQPFHIFMLKWPQMCFIVVSYWLVVPISPRITSVVKVAHT